MLSGENSKPFCIPHIPVFRSALFLVCASGRNNKHFGNSWKFPAFVEFCRGGKSEAKNCSARLHRKDVKKELTKISPKLWVTEILLLGHCGSARCCRGIKVGMIPPFLHSQSHGKSSVVASSLSDLHFLEGNCSMGAESPGINKESQG